MTFMLFHGWYYACMLHKCETVVLALHKHCARRKVGQPERQQNISICSSFCKHCFCVCFAVYAFVRGHIDGEMFQEEKCWRYRGRQAGQTVWTARGDLVLHLHNSPSYKLVCTKSIKTLCFQGHFNWFSEGEGKHEETIHSSILNGRL